MIVNLLVYIAHILLTESMELTTYLLMAATIQRIFQVLSFFLFLRQLSNVMNICCSQLFVSKYFAPKSHFYVHNDLTSSTLIDTLADGNRCELK